MNRKKYFMIFTILFILGLIFQNYLYVKEPDWVNKPKKDSKYYYVVGYAEDMNTFEAVKELAYKDAISKIANSIFQETTVEKIYESFGMLNTDDPIQKSFREKVQTSSAVNLKGVEIEDVYKEEQDDAGLKIYKVWILAKISHADREKEAKRVQEELKRKLELVDKNVRQAEEAIRTGKVFDAVDSFLSAAISSTKVKERSDEFIIYIDRVGKILGNIFIEADNNNPKNVDITKGSQLKFKVYYSTGEGKIPVNGARILFVIKNNDGDYTRNAVSDNNGEVVCKINSLKNVISGNKLYATLNIDFQSILDLGNDYKKYYSTLKDYVEQAFAVSEFKTVSQEKQEIPTSIVAVVDDNGKWNLVPGLISEVQSIMLKKGYKVVKFDQNNLINDIIEGNSEALKQLLKKGIKRIYVLTIRSEGNIKYDKEMDRYFGNYSISSQLMETDTGNVISSENIKLSASSTTQSGVFDSFIKGAGKKIEKLIE